MAQLARHYREQIAVALLVVAVVYVGCGLGLLFKNYDLARIGFSEKSALDGYLFSHPVVIACIAVAVLLVAAWGEPSAHARTLVLAAIGIGAVALVFAVITWIAAFSSADGPFSADGGIDGAGKVVGAFIVLAQMALLVLVIFFAGMALQTLPRPVPAARHWGTPYQQGWGPGQDWQQHGEWPGQQYPPSEGQPPYHGAPPGAPWAAPQPGHWSQPPGWQQGQPADAGWGRPPSDAGWQQPVSGWQSPPSYSSGYEPAPTHADGQSDEAESASSNADLYWRSTSDEDEARDDDAAASSPSHLATDGDAALGTPETSEMAATETFADPGAPGEHAAAAPDDAPTAVGSWSHDAGPSASELAAAPGEASDPADSDDAEGDGDGDESPDGGEGSHLSDDGTDTSGWWRPSSST